MKPFGYYKKSIDSILENSYTNKTLFKENFHIIMGAMKMTKDFREFFTLYNEVENSTIVESIADTYISETISYLRPKIKNIKNVCNILDKVFEKRKNLIKIQENKFYDNLDYLIFKTGAKNIKKRIEHKHTLVESIKNRKVIDRLKTSISPKLLAHSLSENYNKVFNSLNENEKTLISEVLKLDEQKLKEEFEINKGNIVNRINKLVSEHNDDNLKAKLVETKNKVLTMQPTRISVLQLKQFSQDLNS